MLTGLILLQVGVDAADGGPLQETLQAANAAWARKDFVSVRTECVKVLADAAAPAHYQSYAHLRIAQSYVAEGNRTAAEAEYAKIAATGRYPASQRYEAEECMRELARVAKGLPPRDPGATRLKVDPAPVPGREFVVAPDGDDANPGTARRPFATLTKARDAVRTLIAAHALPAGGVAVTLKPGEYRVREPLVLTAADSGTAAAPVVYRARRQGTAVLYGGTRLRGFQMVTDPGVLARLPAEARGQVWQCDLKALGITDYGQLQVRGYAQPPAPPTLEVYVNQVPMTLARWPNQGFVHAARLVEAGSKQDGRPSVLAYDADRPARWLSASDAWLFGYFRFLWADATIRIGRIDPAAKTITTAEAYEYPNAGPMEEKHGIIYYAFNLLEEIDEPGEWYLDRTSGILYLYPPTDLAKATVEISLLSQPMIEAQGVSHVRFEGLILDLARGDGIILKDAEDCLVGGCTIRRMAGNGISILGGHRDVLVGCDIHTIGRRASEVIGGDRATLTPGGHVVENCRIHDFGRIDRTYTPGVQLEGVGNRVAHNLFYSCPSSVARIEGNDHLIEFNEVRHAVLESDDQGAMELFGNPTYRGVVFRYNLFREIGPQGREVPAVAGRAAIRFDDVISGMLVYGNIFYRAAYGAFGAVQINSGRDDLIENNLFAECRECVTGGWEESNGVWQQIKDGRQPADFYLTGLYRTRYPSLAHLFDLPALNYLWRNVAWRCAGAWEASPASTDQGKSPVVPPARARPDRWELFQNVAATDARIGFVNAAKGDFRFRQGTAAFFEAIGFHPIPVEEIGLYRDRYRRELPRGP